MKKQNIKMVAIDLDDTLLDADKGISGRNRRAVEEVIAKGVKLVFATGRSYKVVDKYASLFKLETPLITANGAVIRMPNQGKRLDNQLLEGKILKQLFDEIKEEGYNAVAVVEGRLISPKKIEWLDKFNCKNPMSSKVAKIKAENYLPPVVANNEYEVVIYGEAFYDEINSVEKIMLIIDNEKIYTAEKEINKKFKGLLYGAISKEPCLEVMQVNASKGRGVAMVADYYNIKQEEVMCIGDSFNDLDMLEFAGIGVLMGDGAKALREKVDFVTATNEDDGVAVALEKFILN